MGNTLQQMTHDGLSALIRLPTRTAGASKRPLLCFLHGYDEAAPTALEPALTRHGPLHEAAPPELLESFLIVAPQLPRAGDLWHRYANVVHALIARLLQAHQGDPSRCYLTGFSFGANGVFDLPLLQPRFWAALWAVDPTRLPEPQLREPAWLSIGEVARRQAYEFVDRLQSKPPDESLLAPRVHVDAGDDHVGAARRAYADARIYRWLLAHPLPGDSGAKPAHSGMP